MKMTIYVRLAVGLILLLIITSNSYASSFQVAGHVLLGTTSGDQDSSGFGVLAQASGQVYPRVYLSADIFAATARSIADKTLAPFESLTQQFTHIGGRYAVLQDLHLTAYLGAGYAIYGYQYRDGVAGSDGYDLRGQGPYGQVFVQSHSNGKINFEGEANVSWLAKFQDNAGKSEGTLSSVRGKVGYTMMSGLSLEATLLSNRAVYGNGTITSTWYGLGVSYRF